MSVAFKKLSSTAEGQIIREFLDEKIRAATKTLCEGAKEEFEANQARLQQLEEIRALL